MKIFNPEGYFMDGDFYYYRKDHLGNNCEVWNATQNRTVQKTDYYPSGMPMYSPNTLEAENNPQKLNRHRYNGKEFIEDMGYDVTDLGNRVDYNAINRFTSMDRFCEKFPWQSPYVVANNNPVRYVDVNGDSIMVTVNDTKYWYLEDEDGNWSFFDEEGNAYTGDDKFMGKLEGALAQLQSKENGAALVKSVAEHKNTVQIFETTGKTEAANDGSEIHWNSEDRSSGIDQSGYSRTDPFINLGHELAHVQDVNNGTFDNSTWFVGPEGAVMNAEKYAMKVENQIRDEHGKPLRTHYIGIPDRNNQPVKYSFSIFSPTPAGINEHLKLSQSRFLTQGGASMY